MSEECSMLVSVEPSELVTAAAAAAAAGILCATSCDKRRMSGHVADHALDNAHKSAHKAQHTHFAFKLKILVDRENEITRSCRTNSW